MPMKIMAIIQHSMNSSPVLIHNYINTNHLKMCNGLEKMLGVQ